MKKFKTLAISLLLTFVASGMLFGQEHKVDLSSGKIKVIEVNRVTIEGHNENFVLIKSSGHRNDDSDRAHGLKTINSLGLEDNTGIGLAVEKNVDEVTVYAVSKHTKARYTIYVPKNVAIQYQHSTHHGKDLRIENVQSEIEITLNFNSVYLQDVTGPMTINTVHGDVEAVFTDVNQDNPISIASAHGHIDVALPENTKARMRLSSNWGEIYTDLKIDVEKTGGMRKISSSDVRGNVNGGGVDISLSSTHNNIYVRKKK